MSFTFGGFLSDLREQKHWTVTEASKELGIHRAYLWLLENDKRKKPRPEIIKKLALGYGVSINELLEHLGYFGNAEEKVQIDKKIEEQKINNIFSHIQNDSSFQFGTRLNGKNLDLETKKIIIGLYEKATGKKF